MWFLLSRLIGHLLQSCSGASLFQTVTEVGLCSTYCPTLRCTFGAKDHRRAARHSPSFNILRYLLLLLLFLLITIGLSILENSVDGHNMTLRKVEEGKDSL